MSRASAVRGSAARLTRSAARRFRSVSRHLHRGGPLSVVLVVRARGAFLDEALRSVLAPGHPVGEVLVVGDPSDPIVRERLESTTFDERRVRHFRPTDRTIWLDEAVRAARGDYLAFMDADDLIPAQTDHRAHDVRHAPQEVPVADVDCRGVSAYQHLVVVGRWPVDVLDAQDIRGAVPVLDDRLHR